MDFQIKRVVMTGGSGPVGLALIRKLLNEGVDILLLQRKNSLKRIYLPKDKSLTVEYCTLDELSSFMPNHNNYDVFFHLGWTGTGKEQRDNFEEQYKNVKYACDAVDLAYRCGCHSFIGIGSQAEYGRKNMPLSGDMLCTPETAYGIMKLCACHATRVACQKYGIRYAWCRILSGYGLYDNLNSLLISAILNSMEGKRLEFSKGEQIWDFTYLDDIANALYLIGKRGKDGGVYPIGSGKARPLKEYLCILCEQLGKLDKMELGKIPYSDTQIMHLEADISKLQADTGWKPEVDFEDGIVRVINFYKEWIVKWKSKWEQRVIEQNMEIGQKRIEGYGK